MFKKIFVALTVVFVTASMAVADPSLFSVYGIVGDDLRGVGAGITAKTHIPGLAVYMGGEVDEVVGSEQDETASLALGINFPLMYAVHGTLYGLVGTSFGDNQEVVPGGGFRLTWTPFVDPFIGLTAGVRMTERSDPALTVGVTW